MIKLQIKRVDISVHRRRRVRSFQVDLLRDDLRCVGLELEGKRVEGFVCRGKALQFLVLDVRYAVSALQAWRQTVDLGGVAHSSCCDVAKGCLHRL